MYSPRPGVVKSKLRHFIRLVSVFSMPFATKRLPTVAVASSQASRPLPVETIAAAVAFNSSAYWPLYMVLLQHEQSAAVLRFNYCERENVEALCHRVDGATSAVGGGRRGASQERRRGSWPRQTPARQNEMAGRFMRALVFAGLGARYDAGQNFCFQTSFWRPLTRPPRRDAHREEHGRRSRLCTRLRHAAQPSASKLQRSRRAEELQRNAPARCCRGRRSQSPLPPEVLLCTAVVFEHRHRGCTLLWHPHWQCSFTDDRMGQNAAVVEAVVSAVEAELDRARAGARRDAKRGAPDAGPDRSREVGTAVQPDGRAARARSVRRAASSRLAAAEQHHWQRDAAAQDDVVDAGDATGGYVEGDGRPVSAVMLLSTHV